MASLKSAIPELASILITLSENALYERQRALVRAGLLTQVEGRGPGTGVELSAGSLAMMMVAVLATDSLSEIAESTTAIASIKRVRDEKNAHLLKGARTLAAAIKRSLSSDDAADAIGIVKVHRFERSATLISAPNRLPIKEMYFGENRYFVGNFSITAELAGDTFYELRQLLKRHEKWEALVTKARSLR